MHTVAQDVTGEFSRVTHPLSHSISSMNVCGAQFLPSTVLGVRAGMVSMQTGPGLTHRVQVCSVKGVLITTAVWAAWPVLKLQEERGCVSFASASSTLTSIRCQ